MSRSTPEWIAKHDDQAVPPRVKLRIFERHNGYCHISGRKIRSGEAWDVEHCIALCNGGEHRENNMAPALREKHREKTAADVAEKSKTYQRKAKHFGLKKSSRPISGWQNFRGEPVRNPKLSRPRAQGGGR